MKRLVMYYCDTDRHLICVPYSRENLHIMAKELNINRCWFHPNPDHYDIPKKRIDEIMKKCTIITTKELIKLIKQDEDKEDLFILESTDMNHELSEGWLDIIKKLCNLKSIEYVTERPKNAYSFMAGTRECFILLDEKIDYTKEIEKLKGEIKYQQGFLDSVMKKLNNQKFIEKAPQNVIETEKNKRDEAESKIRSLNEQIKQYERDSGSMETT